MILDRECMFDWNQPLTASRASTDVINLVNNREISAAMAMNPVLKIVVTAETALVSAGATTLAADFQGSTDGSTWDTYASIPAVPKANLGAGATLRFTWVHRGAAHGLPTQVRLNYTVATGPFTGGNISAVVVLDQQEAITYPAGVVIQN
jgi:hypothetical protein